MKVAAAVVCAVALAASGVAARQSDPGVGKVREAYQKALITQDAAALAKLYAADGVEMPPNAPAQKGRAAIEAFHKGLAKEWMNHGTTITATQTTVAGDHAIDIGTYKQTLMPMKGGPMVDEVGKYIVVMKKDGAGWTITHAIYNSDNPPPGAAAPKK